MSVKIRGTDEYLYTLTEPVSVTPFTISCWFKAASPAHNQIVVAIDKPDVAGYEILGVVAASGQSAGDPVRAYNYNGSAYGVAATSSGYSVNTWTHGCGVFTNDTSRDAFIDGGSKGSDTDNVVGTPSELVISRRRRNSAVGPFQATSYLAEVAVWSVALSDANVALLAGGANPLDVDAGNLVAYWPLLDDALDDVGSNNLTEVGTLFDVDHPTIEGAGPTEYAEGTKTVTVAATVSLVSQTSAWVEGTKTVTGATAVSLVTESYASQQGYPTPRPSDYGSDDWWDEDTGTWVSAYVAGPGSWTEYVLVISEEGEVYFRTV